MNLAFHEDALLFQIVALIDLENIEIIISLHIHERDISYNFLLEIFYIH